jgi:Putative Ig domain
METRMTIKFSDITGGGIPYGNNAGRPANPGIGKLYSNGEEKRLELYTSSGWQNIVSETPGVVSVSGNYNESAGSATLDITGTNFSTGAIASAIGTNGIEVNANSTTVNSIVSITTTFSGLSAAYEPYDIKVTNTSNLFGLLPDALYINQSPIWQTSSGSLGTFNEQVNITLSAISATDPESTPITYSLANGSSLPSGVTLNSSTGVISGTLPNITSDTTYTFTVNASDGANIIPRSFSITALVLSVVSGGVLTSDSTYYYRVFKSSGTLSISEKPLTADALIIAGGGGGGADLGGGGGAGGVLYSSNINLTTGDKTVTVGNGGTGGFLPTGNTETFRGSVNAVGLNGGNSVFNGLTAIGGGGAAGYLANGDSGRAKVAQSGGSGGGGGTSSGSGAVNAGGAGTNGQGYAGGSGAGDSLYGGGGGGGAGSAGSNGTTSTGGNGGAGTNAYSSWISAISSVMSDVSGWSSATSSGYIAGGGGGSLYNATGPSSVTGQGGIGGGGGGAWGSSTNPNGYNGIANTGGGGGGSGYNSGQALNGGTGGSGLVVIRYLKSAVSI